MSRAEFVHLHVHSEYSLLDGACRLDRLVQRARELGFPALAITDHGVLYGAIDFYLAAREQEIRPILGCEVYVATGSRFEKKSSGGGKDVYHHLLLLAANNTGYRNLIQLVTAAHLEGYYYKPRVDKELLAAHASGIIALSGCLASEVPDLIARDQLVRARETIDWFRQVYGPDHYYLELQNHGLAEQGKVNRQLTAWAPEFGLKLVATNDVHYLLREHSHAHDCLICIGTQSLLSDTKRLRYQPEQFYLRSADEMASLFAEVPEAVRNTLEVAERCQVEIPFGQLHYPVFHPPEGTTREAYLRQLLADGLEQRYGIRARPEGETFVVESVEDPRRLPTWTPEGATETGTDAGTTPPALSDPPVASAVGALLDRLLLELRVIEKTGFVSYFLIVGDFVRHGRSKGVACVARGSAAGSLVTYLLEISNVDPIRYGLLFERFLNPERVNPPDIDIDFADDRRADVIEYVRQKYGEECVAQIVTFGTMGAKSVIRDVGRVMGLSYSECDRLAKMIPNELKMTLAKALQQSADFKQAYDTEEATRELVDTAFVLEDLTRNASVHAAGVVIGGEPLVNLLPLKRDENGSIVTQYAMGPVGELGLLKMDFLGLKTLTVIRNTCEMVQRTRNIAIPIDRLPLEDAPTYELLNRAQTLGVFQLESSGMRDLCRKFQIRSLDHITALIALYRPGPMDLIPDFIRRRNGEVKIEYEHPLLEPICRETYGIMVYQEQVMQAAQVLAGYTLGAADLLRRAMGKKKVEEMAQQRSRFVEGCARTNQIPAAKANEIFDLLEKFAGYGFNKSHAAAYAVVAYQTAYLKANYPVEFLSAMMTNDMADTAKLGQYIAEARTLGISVLPPNLNESGVYFEPAPTVSGSPPHADAATLPTPHRGAIRFGLAAIKGVGEIAVASVLEARRQDGPFLSLYEFCERVDTRAVNRKTIEAFVRSGACDAFGQNRATLFSQIDRALSRASSLAADRLRGQASLFGGFGDDAVHPVDPTPLLEEWPEHQRLAHEKELLGFYVTGHPLTPHLPLLEKYALTTLSGLAQLPNRSLTRTGGLVAAVQSGFSKKSGKPYALVTLEDLDASVQLLCVNENYEKHRALLVPGTPLLVVGEVNQGEDRPKIFPQEILPLEDAPRRYTKQVLLLLHEERFSADHVHQVRTITDAFPGKCPLFLCFHRPSGEWVVLETHERYRVQPGLELQRAIEAAFGEGTYFAKADPTLPECPPRNFGQRSRASEPASSTA